MTTKERKKPERLEAKNGVIVNLSASEDATRTRIVLILVHHLSICGIESLGETTDGEMQKTDNRRPCCRQNLFLGG